MKTILVTAYHGWVFRNLLGSSSLKRVHDVTGAHVVVCVPSDKVSFTSSTYGAEWLTVVSFDVDAIIATRYNKFWHRLAFLIQNSQYVRDQRLERCEGRGGLMARGNYLLVNGLAAFLSRIPAIAHVYRFLDGIFSPRGVVDNLLQAYKPDLVLVGDLFGEADVLFLRNAKKHGIRTAGMVRSWDNTTTKGILRNIPDRIIANSVTIQRELRVFHRVSEARVSVVGLPQFDSWISGPTLSRDVFFSQMGINPSKRLILFAPAGDVLSDTDWQVCQLLKDAIAHARLPDDIVILVRNHPQHPADFTRFIPDEHFIMENPGTRTLQGNYKGATLNPSENDHLRNSIFYSEIVMYVATSIGLDATVYDKPQIIVSFDGWETRPYVRSVNRYNREDCLGRMVDSGGTKVVESFGELVRALNVYLQDPSLDHSGRIQAMRDHMHALDGKASERIADAIRKELPL